VASNDGYLLQHVVAGASAASASSRRCNVALAAVERACRPCTAFLGPETGARIRAEHGPADLVVANNVYAHVPDLVGFTEGLRALVADDGWVSASRWRTC
jgi:hypothetical protein